MSRLGVQRALGLPECATPPQEVYELAKRRGMDFVTITDHDTIDGALEIADLPDTFISEELTARFRGEPQAVHVLCFGITPGRPRVAAGARRRRRGLRRVPRLPAASSARWRIPFYAVAAPLSGRHRRRLAELFPIWETRNGSRARELNMPAAIYVETHGGIAVGGSDDHAGIDIGRTFTRGAAGAPRRPSSSSTCAPVASTPRGEQGSAEKWAHAAMALAVRALGHDGERARARSGARARDRRARCCARATRREGSAAGNLAPRDARALLRAWLASVGLDELSEADLVAYMQDDRFTHADLYRRATRAHERLLREAVATALDAAGRGEIDGDRRRPVRGLRPGDPLRAVGGVHRARAREARAAATASARASRSSPTGSARCTASRARSRRSASAASRASRSR